MTKEKDAMNAVEYYIIHFHAKKKDICKKYNISRPTFDKYGKGIIND